MRRLACLLLGLVCCGALLAQPAPDAAPPDSRRVILVPPANLSGAPAASAVIAAALRQALAARVELADSAAVAAVLRENRIRNTAELGSAEVAALSRELQARYLFVGSIDRFQAEDSSAEVTLSARLIDAAAGTVVWVNHAAAHSDRRLRVLGLGATKSPADLAAHAAARLCRSLRLPPQHPSRPIRAIHAPGHRADIRACRRVAVLIMGNESATRFAGHVVTNQLLSELHRAGFAVVDPGRVRELMLDARELTQGEISAVLLARCREELSADFLLTGSVSDYTSVRWTGFDAPAVAFEARLIDTARNDLIWARSYAREGRNSARLFNLGYIHSLTGLSHRMTREAARDLRQLRARVAKSAPEILP